MCGISVHSYWLKTRNEHIPPVPYSSIQGGGIVYGCNMGYGREAVV